MSTSPARQARREAERQEQAAPRFEFSQEDQHKLVEHVTTRALQVIHSDQELILGGREYGIPLVQQGVKTVLDIGSNTGLFLVWAFYQFPGASIHCFEPCKATFSKLKQMVDDGIPKERVTLHNVAVTTRSEAFLRYGVNDPKENSIHDLGCQREEGEKVQTFHPGNLPRADFVKIDTEGCEVEIVTSILGIYRPRAFALEWHSLDDRLRLAKLLRNAGYTVTEEPNVFVNINKGVYIGIIKAWL